MPADTIDTTSPVQAPGGAAAPPAQSIATLTKAEVAQAFMEAMEAREQAARERAAKTATDPLAAANARVAELEAQQDAAVKKARAEEAAGRDRYHTRVRLLDKSGCLDPDAALTLVPDLLTGDDADAAIAAARKARPYLFAAPAPATPPGPTPRTMPSVAAAAHGQPNIPADAQALAQRHGIRPEFLAQAYANAAARARVSN